MQRHARPAGPQVLQSRGLHCTLIMELLNATLGGNATEEADQGGFAQRPQPWRPGEAVPLMDEPTFTWDDCAQAVLYMCSLPLTANVLQMTVMATKAPLIGRG